MGRQTCTRRRPVILAKAITVGGAISLVVACSDSHQVARAPTPPSFSGGGGGSGVTGVVAREVTLRSGGSPLNYDLGDTTVYAPFEDGWAFADSEVGIPSALGVIGEYLENQSGGDTTTDSLGNFHRVTYYGNPPSHIQHFINDNLWMDATMLWVLDLENGAVLLGESYVETYVDGDTLSIWTLWRDRGRPCFPLPGTGHGGHRAAPTPSTKTARGPILLLAVPPRVDRVSGRGGRREACHHSRLWESEPIDRRSCSSRGWLVSQLGRAVGRLHRGAFLTA
jgi:hypothetical protein